VFFFNGEEGVQTDRWVREEWFGITYGPDIQVYYLIAVWCVIATLAMYALTRTPFGRISNAVRDNPERVQFIGYSTHRVRWLAFSLSSFFSGLAGALHAINLEHVGFETVGLARSAVILIAVYIGGTSHFAGPIVGAILITLLNAYLSDITPAWYLYLGLIFVIIVMFAPGGIAGLIMMHDPIRRAEPRLLLRLLPAYSTALGTSLFALAGGAGLIEMLYFLSTTTTQNTLFTLYGISLDTADIWPWLVCIGLAAAGGFGAAALGDSALWLTAPTTAITGVATLGLSKAINERKHARVIVGKPIPVAPYREMEDSKEARKKLTDDLKASMEDLHTGFEAMKAK